MSNTATWQFCLTIAADCITLFKPCMVKITFFSFSSLLDMIPINCWSHFFQSSRWSRGGRGQRRVPSRAAAQPCLSCQAVKLSGCQALQHLNHAWCNLASNQSIDARLNYYFSREGYNKEKWNFSVHGGALVML